MASPAAAPSCITLSDGLAEVDILPEEGAAIARYDYADAEGRAPIFAPTLFGARAVASILLVPWSNRISRGGFTVDGRFVALEPNLPGEAFPIHGNGFQLPWRLEQHSATMARFTLRSEGPSAFRYLAEAIYELEGGALTATLRIANAADIALPFGLGIHPWLPRTTETQLAFGATGVWLEDDRHLPRERLPVARNPVWDYSDGRRLPAGWINNGFDGWDGRARVIWPEHRLALDITASANLSTCIVYSPDRDAPFFCFEPVSHPVDAHHLEHPLQHGLVMLKPGEAFGAWSRFAPHRLGEG